MADTKDNEKKNQTNFLKNLILTGQMNRFIIYMATMITLIVFNVLAVLSLFFIDPLYIGTSGGKFIIIGEWYDFVILSIICSSAIYGVYSFLRLRRTRKIDNRFPDFVRDLSESRKAGMTFTKAIMYSAKGNYGILTSEIEKIARQISWGSSVEDALRAFSKRVNTKLINRTVNLIIEASRSGGNVSDVLDAASKDARELKLIESERKANMLSYVAVIYVSMMVFLVIMFVLSVTLIPSMLGQDATDLSGISGGSSSLTMFDLSALYFFAALVQSGFMGVVAGVFEEGNINAGIKHIFVMLLITWIVFKFLVAGI